MKYLSLSAPNNVLKWAQTLVTQLTQRDATSDAAVTALTTRVAAEEAETAARNSAWMTYTPTISVGSGSLTSASATGRYKQIGKSVFVIATLSITTNGTAATYLGLSLPVQASNKEQSMFGRENTAGFIVGAIISANSSNALFSKYDNTYPGGNGYRITLQGVYESA